MTFAKSDGVLSRFPRLPNSRAALALAHVVSDSKTLEQITPSESSKPSGTVAENYFDTLLKQDGCKAAWDAYTDVKTATGFPQQLAKGTASLTGFRHYWIQDITYLEDYVRVRMAAIAAGGPVKEIQDFITTIQPGLDYVVTAKNDCQQKLGVPLKDIESETKSDKLNTSIAHYVKVIEGGFGAAKPWIDIHFALLPCIKGYYTIATELLKDPKLVKNTLYYTMWIQGNADPSFVKEYDEFLQKAVSTPGPDDWKRWGQIFKIACENEQNFFKLATEDYQKLPQPYNIVDEGNYTISPYGNDNYFLGVNVVSAVDTVQVTTQSFKWKLQNSIEGYTIEYEKGAGTPKTEMLLSVSTDSKPYLEVQTKPSTEVPKWQINPISSYVKDDKTIKGYQLFAPGGLKLVPEWSVSGSKVFVVDNYQGPSQTWILTKAT